VHVNGWNFGWSSGIQRLSHGFFIGVLLVVCHAGNRPQHITILLSSFSIILTAVKPQKEPYEVTFAKSKLSLVNKLPQRFLDLF
jgi:hypothetical protein